jgi:hypothetical protein
MEEKKTTKKPAKKVVKKVEPKLLLSEKIDNLVKETEEIKMAHRSELNTSSHALLNKTLADLKRISKTLKR